MKLILIIFSIALSFNTIGQDKKYDTKIDKAGTVNIYGNGKVVIGQVVINQNRQETFKLKAVIQKKDSTGNFITKIQFVNPSSQITTNARIILAFNHSVESVRWQCGGSRGGSIMSSGGNSADKKQFLFVGTQVICNDYLEAMVKSKEKVFITISGIDGKL